VLNKNLKTMKKRFKAGIEGILLSLLFMLPALCLGQDDKAIISAYMTKLTIARNNVRMQKYRMTAIYTNLDFYGNFTNKTKITGDYTRGLDSGAAKWNNVYISASNSSTEPFPAGIKQEYMENISYIPSQKMLEAGAFKDFPPNPESVLSRNLIWDMMVIEGFAWDNADSLKLNKSYTISGSNGKFAMADIGNYSHKDIQLTWTGISAFNDDLCAVIEFRAIDNRLEIEMPGLKTKGTEQYWGTVWVSEISGLIEYAEMFSGTAQEIEVTGMQNKFVAKTIRELRVEKIN
jgi:hypothetical protein